MDWVSVKSSRISRMRYDEGVLTVQFVRGRVYQYSPVSPDIYNSIANAASVGSALQTEVLDNTDVNVREIVRDNSAG